MMICPFYWIFMHHKIIAQQYKDGPWYKPLCQYALFSVPPFCTFVNAAITKVVLSTKPLGCFLTVALIYVLNNFLFSTVDGKPTITHLTWKRFLNTTKDSTIMLCIFICFYNVLCKMDEWLKPEMAAKREEMSRLEQEERQKKEKA